MGGFDPVDAWFGSDCRKAIRLNGDLALFQILGH